jgi:hypothetical protein
MAWEGLYYTRAALLLWRWRAFLGIPFYYTRQLQARNAVWFQLGEAVGDALRCVAKSALLTFNTNSWLQSRFRSENYPKDVHIICLFVEQLGLSSRRFFLSFLISCFWNHQGGIIQPPLALPMHVDKEGMLHILEKERKMTHCWVLSYKDNVK